jgi:hypothetical protein
MRWNKAPEPDVKDQWIADLRERNATLELENRDLRRELLSALKPASYRQVYGKTEPEAEVVTLGQTPTLSPSRIPPYEITDEKWVDQISERMRKVWEGEPKQ